MCLDLSPTCAEEMVWLMFQSQQEKLLCYKFCSVLVPGDDIEYELVLGYQGDPDVIAARKSGQDLYSRAVEGKSSARALVN